VTLTRQSRKFTRFRETASCCADACLCACFAEIEFQLSEKIDRRKIRSKARRKQAQEARSRIYVKMVSNICPRQRRIAQRKRVKPQLFFPFPETKLSLSARETTCSFSLYCFNRSLCVEKERNNTSPAPPLRRQLISHRGFLLLTACN